MPGIFRMMESFLLCDQRNVGLLAERRKRRKPEPGWLEPRRRASALDAQASPLNYGSKSLSESRQAKHPMPSPKHSASTGTQQPNTADSQGPADLDFINEFQCTNRFQKRQEHTSRSGHLWETSGE